MTSKEQLEALCEASGKAGRDYLSVPSIENLKAFNKASRSFNEALQQLYRSGTLVFRDEALEEAKKAIVEPISAYIYDVLYKMDHPVTSHTHQKTYEAAQAAIDALKSQEAE